MARQNDSVVWILFAYLFSFSSLAAAYFVANEMIDPSNLNAGLGDNKLERITESVRKYRAVITIGTIFTVLSWFVIAIQTFRLAAHGKVYFISSYIWGGIYVLLSPSIIIFVGPVLIMISLNRQKILHPEQFEEPDISPADRVKASSSENSV